MAIRRLRKQLRQPGLRQRTRARQRPAGRDGRVVSINDVSLRGGGGEWQRPGQRHDDRRPAGRPGRHRDRRLGRPRHRRRPDRRRAGRGGGAIAGTIIDNHTSSAAAAAASRSPSRRTTARPSPWRSATTATSSSATGCRSSRAAAASPRSCATTRASPTTRTTRRRYQQPAPQDYRQSARRQFRPAAAGLPPVGHPDHLRSAAAGLPPAAAMRRRRAARGPRLRYQRGSSQDYSAGQLSPAADDPRYGNLE